MGPAGPADDERLRVRALKKAVFALVLGLLAVVAWFIFLREDDRPNVILISIDSLRPDHLGCYGYGRDTSPRIDQLAREGALFETVVSSSSWTLPAHAALFTGLPDRAHGCYYDDRWLDGSRTTIAEAFREAGYNTAGFYSGPYLSPHFGFAQGFDWYRDCTSYSRETIQKIQDETLIGETGMGMDVMVRSHRDITNPIVYEEVMEWADEKLERPFFLFIHLWDVHYDYVPPPPFDTRFDPGYKGPVDGENVLSAALRPESWTDADVEHLKALYDGEIASTDDTLGKILDEFARRGLRDTSVIAVTADHGEAFYEHGAHGHRLSLFDEEIRIPLVIRYPPSVPSERRIAHPASIIDIAPTLLDLVGVPPLLDAIGRSLRPLLGQSGATLAEMEEVEAVCELKVPHHNNHKFALRSSSAKVIFDLSKNKVLLYDLIQDPGEQSPLQGADAAKEGERYEKEAERLKDAAQRLPAVGKRDTPEIKGMTIQQLRDHGYLR